MSKFAVGIFINEKRSSFLKYLPKSERLLPRDPSAGTHIWAKWTDGMWYMFHLTEFLPTQKDAKEACDQLGESLSESDTENPCCAISGVCPALELPVVLPEIDGRTELGPELLFPNSATLPIPKSVPKKNIKVRKMCKNDNVLKAVQVRRKYLAKRPKVVSSSKLRAVAKKQLSAVKPSSTASVDNAKPVSKLLDVSTSCFVFNVTFEMLVSLPPPNRF